MQDKGDVQDQNIYEVNEKSLLNLVGGKSNKGLEMRVKNLV